MATILLTAGGAAAGAKVGAGLAGATSLFGAGIGSTIGGKAGKLLGGFAGQAIDNKIFSNDSNKYRQRVGSRLSNLSVQSSAYGESIPIIYGNARLAGNIIWSEPIKETVNTSTSSTGGGKGGGSGKVTTTTTNFTYSVTLAIAICEGPIDELLRVWADSMPVNTNDGNYRLYKGDEDQQPDSLIEAIEGIGKVPAYRGLSYIVMEDIPLADFGNRIPNFTFEVRKSALESDENSDSLEDSIKEMIIIPGSGEFVYDDTVQTKVPGLAVGNQWVQQGNKTTINQNNRSSKADSLVALDQLENTCKNLEWIAIVATWFGDSLDCAECELFPAVEYKQGAITEPDLWNVAGINRENARQITLEDNIPRYGGTPSDMSLLRYIKEMKNRGYNVMFYPMFFMDIEQKPWRGRVTGSAADISNFFTKTNGYNEFINHYANLVKDDVDAFVIGTELKGLTSVQDIDNSFPAVDEFISLAATVKSIVGSSVKVTYAADWSEYHSVNGWYNLDPLWASANIDFIGIDAYFPLTDEEEPSEGFSKQQIIDGWTDGEGYNFYYSDGQRTIKENLQSPYAWKDIEWWWSNNHTNPDGSSTPWNPQMKKIWFTEYGFPSVDGASNQPNVFSDPDSVEGAFPRFSKGNTSIKSQRIAIKATLEKWENSPIVEKLFLWTWDARPYPFWPDLINVWADGERWQKGHWVNGKLGLSNLGAIVLDLAKRSGLREDQIDVSDLDGLIRGFLINSQTTARIAIDNLRSAYFFDAVESDGKVKFINRGNKTEHLINIEELISSESNEVLSLNRLQEIELPQKIDINYIDESANYQIGNQHSQRQFTNSLEVKTIDLPIVMNSQEARSVAEISLYNSWLEQKTISFNLPIKYLYIEPTDIVNIDYNSTIYRVRILDTKLIEAGIINFSAVIDNQEIYNLMLEGNSLGLAPEVIENKGKTVLKILDLPALPDNNDGNGKIIYAASGEVASWNGAVIYSSNDDGDNFSKVISFPTSSTIGKTINKLQSAVTDYFDFKNSVIVNILGSNKLESKTELAILNGENLALIGNEIIQFKNAELLYEGQYKLSGLLRGRAGTENEVDNHQEVEDFILLYNNIIQSDISDSLIDISREYKAVTVGSSIDEADSQSFTYIGNSLKPYAPVHIEASQSDNNDFVVSWVRRARINGTWRDNVDVPLSEETKIYEIDILNDNNEIVRTVTDLTTENYIYSSADQIEDFGSVQSNLKVKIYQISQRVGRGFEGKL